MAKYPSLYLKTLEVYGLINLEEGVAIYEAALKVKHKSPNIVEVGAYKGLSTIFLAEAASRVKKKVKTFEWFSGLTDIDPVLDADFGASKLPCSQEGWESNVRQNTRRENVELIVGDARIMMPAALHKDGFAMAFLDVDTYKTTLELLYHLRDLATGGEVIFIHNADSAGIQKAVSEFKKGSFQNITVQYILDNKIARLDIGII